MGDFPYGLPSHLSFCFSLQVALLNPIENPDLKLAIVMLIVPFFVNVSAMLHFLTPVFSLPSGVPVQSFESDRENTLQPLGPSVWHLLPLHSLPQTWKSQGCFLARQFLL